MMPSRCETPEILRRWLDGELSPDEQARVEKHIDGYEDNEGCPRCADELERIDAHEVAFWVARKAELLDFGVSPLSPFHPESVAFDFQKLEELGFEIRRTLASGGMGTVYLAFDRRLERTVALKVPKPALASKPEFTARFLREARTAAAVDKNDHIVQIHQVVEGSAEFPLPFLVMEYLDGGSLASRLEGGRQLPPEVAADIARQVALGLAAAHAKGLVHRDVKPSNILFASNNDRAKLADFGITRAVDAIGPSMTREGAFVGTPDYSSPEQVNPSATVDSRSDLFSLGVVLYEMLTGSRPFQGTPDKSVVHEILTHEPLSPRSLVRSIPPDLETICLKCLEKSPHYRYESAAAVAEDLRRYLAREPIIARPPSPVGRLSRWAQRQPWAAAFVAACMTAALTIIAGTIWYNNRLSAELAEKSKAQKATEQALKEAVKAREEERRGAYVSTIGLAAREYENGQVSRARDLLMQRRPQSDRTDLRDFEWHYLWRLANREGWQHWMGSKQHIKAVRYSLDGSSICSASLDGTIKTWDAIDGHLKQSIALYLGGGIGVALAEQGGQIVIKAVASGGAMAALDDPPHAGDRLVAVGSGDGKSIPTTGRKLDEIVALLRGEPGSRVELEVLREGRPPSQRYTLTRRPLPISTDFAKNVEVMTLSPDGRFLATSGIDGILLWDAATGRLKKPLAGSAAAQVGRARTSASDQRATSLVFSPDSRLLTEGGNMKSSRVWLTATGELKAVIEDRQTGMPCMGVAFLPDNRSLIGPHANSYLTWDVDNPARPIRVSPMTFPGSLDLMAISPDGRWLAASQSSDRFIYLYDLAHSESRGVLRGHRGRVQTLTFSPDSRLLASGALDGTVRLWNVAQTAEIATLPGLDGSVECLDFRNDGRTLVGSGSEGTLTVWDLARRPEFDLVRAHLEGLNTGAAAFTQDGRSFVAAYDSMRVNRDPAPALHAWDCKTGSPVMVLQDDPSGIHWLTSSKDGKTFAVLEHDSINESTSRVSVWDARTWEQTASLGRSEMPHGLMVALSADGQYLATGFSTHPLHRPSDDERDDGWRSNQVVIYRRAQDAWKQEAVLSGFQAPIFLLEFSDNGERLTTVEWGSDSFSTWDWRVGRITERVDCRDGKIHALAISPNGKSVAMAVGGGMVAELDKPDHILLCERGTGKTLARLTGHTQAVSGICFSPDDGRLATASLDGTVRVWDLRGKADPVVLRHVGAKVINVAFSPDGKRLFSVWVGTLQIMTLSSCGLSRWDLATREERRKLATPGALLTSIVVSADGKKVLAGGLHSELVYQWDADTLQESHRKLHRRRPESDGHDGSILCASGLPDGRWLATGSEDKTVKLWDLNTGKVIATLKGHKGPVTHVAFAQATRTLTSVGWVPQGNTLNAEIMRWDLASRKQTGVFSLSPLHQPITASFARANPHAFLAFSFDGETIATVGGDGRSMELWEVASGRRVAVLPDVLAAKGGIICLTVSPDGQVVASAAHETWEDVDQSHHARLRVMLWDVKTRSQIPTPLIIPIITNVQKMPLGEGVFSMAFCPASRSLAVGGSRGDVDIWNIHTGRKMLTLAPLPQPGPVTTLLFSPDGKTLAVGTPGTLALYHASQND
jgi:WD40 repeat protein/serine/threonine protein kinase